VAIEGQNIVLDGNHPLAGVTLHFDVEVMSIREATKEELAHGHLHSHGSSCSG
jgi:FKBP-type peptidyl-prolyl cis-trans isomerase SlyD